MKRLVPTASILSATALIGVLSLGNGFETSSYSVEDLESLQSSKQAIVSAKQDATLDSFKTEIMLDSFKTEIMLDSFKTEIMLDSFKTEAMLDSFKTEAMLGSDGII